MHVCYTLVFIQPFYSKQGLLSRVARVAMATPLFKSLLASNIQIASVKFTCKTMATLVLKTLRSPWMRKLSHPLNLENAGMYISKKIRKYSAMT